MDALTVLKAFIALPFIFFIPGFVTFNALKANRLDNLRLSLFDTLFLQVLASIVITGWIAFTLAEIGYFSLWLLCGLLLAYSQIITIIFRARFTRPLFPRPKWNFQTVFLILLFVMALSLFFHPSEEINLRYDIGVYINTGVSIAETDYIAIHDPILSAMPDSAKDTFYSISVDDSPWRQGMQFPGFAIVDKDSGAVVPLQPPLRQVWFAIFYSIFGLLGALYSQSVFGLLSVLAVFQVGKTIWNWRVGAIASSILAVNFVQIFFSQYTSPEILFQLLAFSGIATFILFMRTHNGFFGIISAMCFGQLLMTRIDAPLVLIPLVLIVLYILLTSKQTKIYLYFVLPFLVLWFHSLAHIYYLCMPYLAQLFVNVRAAYGIDVTPTLAIAFLLGISVLMAPALLFAAIYSEKFTKLNTMSQKLAKSIYMPSFLLLLIVMFIIYLWLTSPTRELSPLLANLILIPRGGMDPTVALSWFVGWLGLGLALLGLCLILAQKPYAKSYSFLGIIFLSLLFYLYTLSNNPAFPWAMRRAITIVLPATMLLIGYSVERIRDLLTGTLPISSGRGFFAKLTMVLLILALVVPSISLNLTLLKPQFDGFVNQVEEVADFFPANAIILEASSGAINRLSVPLKYIYDKNSISLWKEPANADEFAEMVKLWNKEGREVYLIAYPQNRFDSISSKLSETIEFRNEVTFLLQVSRIVWKWSEFPNERREDEYQVGVYRIIVR